MLNQPQPALGELVGDLTRQVATLVKDEFSLARAEMVEKLTEVRRDVALLAMAAMLSQAASLVLLGALVAGLVAVGMSTWVAALIVGVITTVLSAALTAAALGRLKSVSLTPTETIQTLKEDAAWAKTQAGRH